MTDEEWAAKYDSAINQARNAKSLILYEGMMSLAAEFYGREYTNLFPGEKLKVVEVQRLAEEAADKIISDYLGFERKLKDEARRNPSS